MYTFTGKPYKDVKDQATYYKLITDYSVENFTDKVYKEKIKRYILKRNLAGTTIYYYEGLGKEIKESFNQTLNKLRERFIKREDNYREVRVALEEFRSL